MSLLIKTPSLDQGFSTKFLPTEEPKKSLPLAERAETQQVISSLRPLLEQAFDGYGKMPKNIQEQHEFINKNLGKIQDWVDAHITDLKSLQSTLELPNPVNRYGRNLILSINEKQIYVFLHLLNPKMETPKHWHSEKGLPALAFATCLNNGVTETKWQENQIENSLNKRQVIKLENEIKKECTPNKLVAIPGNYGAHIVSNNSDEAAALFEIYFEPEELNNLDLPIPIVSSKVDHIIDTVPTTWLTDRNLLSTAKRESWQSVSEILNDREKLSNDEFSFFTIVNDETHFIPREELQSRINANSKLLQGPGKRFLLL